MNVESVRQQLTSPIALLYGGESPERAVSLNSGAAVKAALERLDLPFVAIDASGDWQTQLDEHNIRHALIMLHGGAGENGEVQALLRDKGITFSGSDEAASQLAMDKHLSKGVWREQSVATAASMTLAKGDDASGVLGTLGSPVIVKPVHEGSSVGMSIAADYEALQASLDEAFKFDKSVLIEPVLSGPEFTVAVLGDTCLPVIMLKPDGQFYDYRAKYLSDDTEYLCPAPITQHQSDAMQVLAKRAFDTIGCRAWGRVDVMMDGDDMYVLEVNTVPGMTDHSLVPKAAQASGIDFDELVLRIVAASLV